MPSFRGCPLPHRHQLTWEALPGLARLRGSGFGAVQHGISLTKLLDRSIIPGEGKNNAICRGATLLY